MPYWNCPYTEPDACELPNECFCPGDFQEIICNNTKYLEQLLKKSCPGDSFQTDIVFQIDNTTT